MKILKKIIVILIIILSILGVRSFASTGTINIDATRLRKENNTTSEILTNIYEDEEVKIVEDLGEWIKVEYKEYTGYIKKQFVDIKEDKEEEKKDTVSNYENTEETPQTSNEATVTATTSIRILPNFMSKQTQQIQEGTNVTVVSQMNQWVKVSDGVVAGWILKTKLNIGTANEQVEPSDLETTNTIANTTNTNTVSNDVKENTVTNTVTKDNTITNQSTMTSVSKKGTVNVETANVRKEPSTSAKRIGFLDEGDVVTITEETEEWYKVEHEDIVGYVSKQLITINDEKGQVSSRSLTEERKEEATEEPVREKNTTENQSDTQVAGASGNAVVEFAKQYLGYSYIVGGKTPETGFDCSGFTYYVYKNFGYTLSTVSYNQTSVGAEVTRENLKPGDLILFYNEEKTKIGHTGVYIGNGDFIHSANPKRGVVCDNINTLSYYDERFVTARRIVE